MAFGICNQSIVAMRAEPAHRSEMVSQLLFGELFSITERQNEWIKISNYFDDYTGWIVSWQIAELSLFEFEKIRLYLDTLGIGQFDLITSDIAPSTTGMTGIDQYRSIELNLAILDVAEVFLKK